MVLLEKELEDSLFEMLKNPCKLLDRGFMVFDDYKYERQVKIGEYGIADIVGIKIMVNEEQKKVFCFFHIIELKKDSINFNALGQAYRYLTGLQIASFYKFDNTYELITYSHVSLVGSSINETDDFCFMSNYANSIQLYTYNYCPFNGITFKTHNKILNCKEFKCLDNIKIINLSPINFQ